MMLGILASTTTDTLKWSHQCQGVIREILSPESISFRRRMIGALERLEQVPHDWKAFDQQHKEEILTGPVSIVSTVQTVSVCFLGLKSSWSVQATRKPFGIVCPKVVWIGE
jgi:hypothetical protein